MGTRMKIFISSNKNKIKIWQKNEPLCIKTWDWLALTLFNRFVWEKKDCFRVHWPYENNKRVRWLFWWFFRVLWAELQHPMRSKLRDICNVNLAYELHPSSCRFRVLSFMVLQMIQGGRGVRWDGNGMWECLTESGNVAGFQCVKCTGLKALPKKAVFIWQQWMPHPVGSALWLIINTRRRRRMCSKLWHCARFTSIASSPPFEPDRSFHTKISLFVRQEIEPRTRRVAREIWLMKWAHTRKG